jgi:hypothetical protein
LRLAIRIEKLPATAVLKARNPEASPVRKGIPTPPLSENPIELV